MSQPTLFSQWMRTNLKDAFSGLITQDIDFIINRDDNKFFVVEEKNIPTARTGPAQAVIYKMINEILSGDDLFLGCHKVTALNFDGTDKIYLDQSKWVTFDEFIKNPNSHLLNDYGETWYDSVLHFSLKYMWDGKGNPPYHKTEVEHTFNRASQLMPVLVRNGVSNSKIDWIFVNYVTGYFVLLSESDCFNDDTVQRIIDDFYSYNESEFQVLNPKSGCVYKFLGAYNINYTDDMSEFEINGQKISAIDAIRILNLDTEEITQF